MYKKIVPVLLIVVTLASCSSMKPLNFSNSKQVDASSATVKSTSANSNKEVKFLDDISVEPAPSDTRISGTNKTNPGKKNDG